LTIVFGVLGRGISAISSYIGYNLTSMFNFGLRFLDIPKGYRKLEGTETSELVFDYLKTDFPADYPNILEIKNMIQGTEPDKYDSQVKKFYASFIKAKKDKMDYKIQDVNDLMIDTFGLKKNYFENYKTKNNRFKGIVMRICSKSSLMLYGLSLICFLIAVVYISIKFLELK
jgi:hypothetical protein